MKRFSVMGLILVLGVSLIGMFGCTSGRSEDTEGNVFWNHPGGYLVTMDKSTIKKLDDFAYRVEGRGERHYSSLEIYYTNNEPTVDIGSGNLLIEDVYAPRAKNKIYDRETKEFLGSPCYHYPKIEITPPYTKITQEVVPKQININTKDKIIF